MTRALGAAHQGESRCMGALDYERDHQLVRRAVRADRKAMRQIVERHQDRVYRLIYRMVGDVEVAQDLTQETFLKALQKLDGLHQGQALHRWLSQVATNLVRDLWRTRKERKEHVEFDESTLNVASPFPHPGRDAESRQAGERIQAALMELPLTYREAFLLRYVEEMSYEEMGEALDLGISAAKVRVHRARKMLRDLLPEYAVDGGTGNEG